VVDERARFGEPDLPTNRLVDTRPLGWDRGPQHRRARVLTDHGLAAGQRRAPCGGGEAQQVPGAREHAAGGRSGARGEKSGIGFWPFVLDLWGRAT